MSLNRVYNYWFNPKIKNLHRHWIPIADKDQKLKLGEIEKNFLNLYVKVLFQSLVSYKNCENSYKKLSNKLIISLVIILDQFTRTLGKKYTNIKKFKMIASKMCIRIESDIIKGDFLELDQHELIFVLMPYKHIDIQYFTLVNKVIEIYCESNNVKLCDLTNLQRFYIDYYKKYVFLTFPSKSQLFIGFDKKYHVSNNIDFGDICNIDGFLPTGFENVEYNLTQSKLSEIEEYVYKILKNRIKGNICVSLSGGVDSMVLTYILKRLEKKLNINVCAFHITYNNREDSAKEKLLIWNFCNKLDVELYNYNIEYIKRRIINRDDYESITREIRFNCYRIIGCPIVLGHIREDKIENILTNISTNKHMFDLSKIHVTNTINGIQILRPFVNMDKEEIISYSHNNKIPYLNNTTPLWSNRGKFRNSFMKAYHEQYGIEGINNLERFAETLENYGELIEDSIITPCLDKLNDNHSIILSKSLRKNSHLVREIFKRYSHGRGFNMPSEKSIKGLIEIVDKMLNKKYELSKNIRLHIEGEVVRCI